MNVREPSDNLPLIELCDWPEIERGRWYELPMAVICLVMFLSGIVLLGERIWFEGIILLSLWLLTTLWLTNRNMLAGEINSRRFAKALLKVITGSSAPLINGKAIDDEALTIGKRWWWPNEGAIEGVTKAYQRIRWPAIVSAIRERYTQMPILFLSTKERSWVATEQNWYKPFTVPFQPILFKEIRRENRQKAGLASLRASTASSGMSETEHASEKYTGIGPKPKIKISLLRRVLLTMVFIVLFVIVPGIVFVSMLFQQPVQISAVLGFIGFVVLLVYLVELYRAHLVLVPAGIVKRTTELRKKGWDIKLLTRDNTLLVIGEQRTLVAMDLDGKFLFRESLSDEELQFILCAWFSPLEPPREDELIDLC